MDINGQNEGKGKRANFRFQRSTWALGLVVSQITILVKIEVMWVVCLCMCKRRHVCVCVCVCNLLRQGLHLGNLFGNWTLEGRSAGQGAETRKRLIFCV